MDFLSDVLLVLGVSSIFAGFVWSWALAARESTVYGVACLLAPVLLYFFMVTRLGRTWRPALLLTGGIVVTVCGYKLG
jgi:hypothetical protein